MSFAAECLQLVYQRPASGTGGSRVQSAPFSASQTATAARTTVRGAVVRVGRVLEQARGRREHRWTDRAVESRHGGSEGDDRVCKEHGATTAKRTRRRKQRRTRGGRAEATEDSLCCLVNVERRAVYIRASASALPLKKRTTPDMPCGREASTSCTACRIQ